MYKNLIEIAAPKKVLWYEVAAPKNILFFAGYCVQPHE